MRMWVRSLASLSGLRIWHCCELQHRLQVQLGSGIADLNPSLGISVCYKCSPKKQEKKQRIWMGWSGDRCSGATPGMLSPWESSHIPTSLLPGQTWRAKTIAAWCRPRRPEWKVWSWSCPPMPITRAILSGARSWPGWRTWPPLQPGEGRELPLPLLLPPLLPCHRLGGRGWARGPCVWFWAGAGDGGRGSRLTQARG